MITENHHAIKATQCDVNVLAAKVFPGSLYCLSAPSQSLGFSLFEAEGDGESLRPADFIPLAGFSSDSGMVMSSTTI